MTRVLVIDDLDSMRESLVLMLESGGLEADVAGSGEEGIAKAREGLYDVVLTDLRMGKKSGLDVVRELRSMGTRAAVLLMTAYGSIESAVEAVRLGAFDYLEKPFTEQELLVKIERALEHQRMSGQLSLLASEFRERYQLSAIIGRSSPIRDVMSRIVRVAPTDATVLITGESGTGKELVARAIHANSARSDKPFVPINCAAISENLLESELFGHARGAFTGATQARVGLFEEADGGTFFFDEVAETPISFQAKLLRVLQEGEIRRVGENRSIKVDVRIVAATNQDLSLAIAERRFRQDLYYRLNVARFQLPSLRDRREDIPLLAEHFFEKSMRKMKKRVRLSEGLIEALTSHEFPGNVRELENLIEQAIALADGEVTLDDLMPEGARSAPREDQTLQSAVDQAERRAIGSALADTGGNRERAAELLGISPTTLWRKMTRLGIREPS